MPLDPLATLDDLNLRLKTPVAVAEDLEDAEHDELRARALLDDASAAVRGYTGQEFTAGTRTDELIRPRNGFVRLPQRPVTAVEAVTDKDGNPLLFEWIEGDDRVTVSSNVLDTFAWEPWRTGVVKVLVTYDFGYAEGEIPQDIIAVVCQMAARAYGTSPSATGLQSESIDGYSYSVGAAAAAGAIGMLAGETAVLDRYRTPQVSSALLGVRT